MTKPWTLERTSPNAHRIRYDLEGPSCGRMLLLADLHWDNPKCDRKLLKSHLDEAKENNCPVLLAGDTFCAMQGKYDKRSSKDDLLPEHRTVRYLDALIETAADFFEPYKDVIAILGQGNHETSILARHETCLVDRLAAELRKRGGIAQTGGYSGFIRLVMPTTSTQKHSIVLWYMHGHGGGGPVTKGLIDFNRYVTMVDADVIFCGHVHYRNSDEVVKMYLNQADEQKYRTVLCLRAGTYKEEYAYGKGGFHVEKGRGPRPLGGWWLDVHMSARERRLVTAATATRPL